MRLNVTFGRDVFPVDVDEHASLEALAGDLQSTTGVEKNTIKLFSSSVRGAIQPSKEPTRLVSSTGLHDAAKVMMVASFPTDVAQVLTARDDQTVIGFEEELLRYARRRNLRGTVAPTPPSGPYTFQSYRALALPDARPSQSEALKLLHRLAADPGISGIMIQHRFEVGLLSEMPPTDFMDDQRSVTCLLGLNVNRGQEIKLRLRTNDLKGFRKYENIRETLVHELTHNVFGDHDDKFKTLNSQLLRECVKLSKAGQKLMSNDVYEGQAGDYLDAVLEKHDAVAAGGRKLSEGGSSSRPALPATRAAGEAALARLQRAAATAAIGAAPAGQEVKDIARAYEHDDPSTAAEEAAFAAMGAVPDAAQPSASSVPTQRVSPRPSVGTSQPTARARTHELGVPSNEELPGPLHPPDDARQDDSPAPPSAAANAAQPDTGSEDMDVVLISHTRGPSPAQTTTDHGADGRHDTAGRSAADVEMASVGEQAAELGMAPDDPSLEQVARVNAVMDELAASTTGDQLRTTLETLHKILSNSLTHPGNERYASVRRNNALFLRTIGAWPAAERLLQLAGFALEDGERWSLGGRPDAGRLWLVTDLVKLRIAH